MIRLLADAVSGKGLSTSEAVCAPDYMTRLQRHADNSSSSKGQNHHNVQDESLDSHQNRPRGGEFGFLATATPRAVQRLGSS